MLTLDEVQEGEQADVFRHQRHSRRLTFRRRPAMQTQQSHCHVECDLETNDTDEYVHWDTPWTFTPRVQFPRSTNPSIIAQI